MLLRHLSLEPKIFKEVHMPPLHSSLAASRSETYFARFTNPRYHGSAFRARFGRKRSQAESLRNDKTVA